jgi:hypothetical protein
MAFSIAEYENTISKLHEANGRHRNLVTQARQTVQTVLDVAFFVPAPARNWITKTMDEVVAEDHNLFERILDTLASAWVPLALADRANRWTELGSVVTSMAGNLQPINRDIDIHWKGAAAEAYESVAAAHQLAASRIGDLTERTQQALSWMTNVGAAFYIGLLVIALKLVAGVAAALMGISSGVGVPAGLAIMLTIVATAAAEIVSMVALFIATYAWARVQMNNMLSEAYDQSAFPNGRWPVGAAHSYDDATVTDGDADWSLERP